MRISDWSSDVCSSDLKCRIAEDDSDVSEDGRLCSANWRQSRSIVINQAHAMLPRRWEGTSIMEYGQSFGRDLVAGICAAAMMSMSSIAHAVPVNGLRDPAFRYIYGSYAPGGDCSREPRVTINSAGMTFRSEGRRVGKECVSTGRSRWWPDH